MITDPLKARQYIAHFYAIAGGHRIGQRGGDDGLDRHRILGHGAGFNPALADVVQQQNADLIAGNQLIASVGAANGDAHPVCVRVRCQHQVCIVLLRQFQTQPQGFKNLRVGVGAGGEVAVRVLLLGDNGNVVNADVMEHPGHGHQAGAVQGGVDQLEPGGLAQAGPHGPGLDGIVQGFLAVLAHILDHAGGQTFLKRNQLGPFQHVGFLNFRIDNGGGIVGHLAAVGAIGLVAVVLGGVVRSGDHNTGVGPIVAGGKAQCGHGHQCVIDPYPDAVGCQHTGSGFRKDIGIDTAVIGNGNQLIAALGFDPIGKALGGLTDHIDIHPVGARTQNAPESGGTEFQGDRKPILDLVLVPLNIPQLLGKLGILQIGGGPTLVIIQIHDVHLSFMKCTFCIFAVFTIKHFPLFVNVAWCSMGENRSAFKVAVEFLKLLWYKEVEYRGLFRCRQAKNSV